MTLIDCNLNEQLSLALNVVASALLRRPESPPIGQQKAPEDANSLSSPLTTAYIVAPHTYQTIPLLHALLAKRMSNSAAAVDLLKKVQLLQFFDLAGLVESITEVSESIYQLTQVGSQRNQMPPKATNAHQEPQHVVLIEGLASTLSATQRRSGFVQANALLAGLTRSITQLSKLSGRPLVLISVPIDVRTGSEPGQTETTHLQRDGQGLPLESAFSGRNWESYTLVCGSMILSQTLARSLDQLVHVHDAFGRAQSRRKDPKLPIDCVIEVMKDRVGNLTGLWAPWQSQIA